jgi:hypothetical protein
MGRAIKEQKKLLKKASLANPGMSATVAFASGTFRYIENSSFCNVNTNDTDGPSVQLPGLQVDTEPEEAVVLPQNIAAANHQASLPPLAQQDGNGPAAEQLAIQPLGLQVDTEPEEAVVLPQNIAAANHQASLPPLVQQDGNGPAAEQLAIQPLGLQVDTEPEEAVVPRRTGRCSSTVKPTTIASGPPKKRKVTTERSYTAPNRKMKRATVPDKVTPPTNAVRVEQSPKDNDPEVQADIASTMSDWSHMYTLSSEFRATRRPGASKKACMEKQKRATLIFEDFLPMDECIYTHYVLLAAADEITADCDKINPETGVNGWTVLENNAGENDGLRRAANHCMRSNKPLNDLVQNMVYLVTMEDCCGGQSPFACGGGGEEFSITLLIALIGALRQQAHTDYDPDCFRAYEDYEDLKDEDDDGNEIYREELEDSHNNFNGASMFINFSWNNEHKLDLGEVDYFTGEYIYIPLPAMSIVIIAGDLVHAGSANVSGVVTRKFFLYLDPRPFCRNLGEFQEGKGYVNDNFIYFGSSRRTQNRM